MLYDFFYFIFILSSSRLSVWPEERDSSSDTASVKSGHSRFIPPKRSVFFGVQNATEFIRIHNFPRLIFSDSINFLVLFGLHFYHKFILCSVFLIAFPLRLRQVLQVMDVSSTKEQNYFIAE